MVALYSKHPSGSVRLLVRSHGPFVATSSFLLLLRRSNNSTAYAVFTKNVSIKVRYPDIFEVDIFEVFLGNVVFINTKTNRRQRQTFRLTHECFFYAARACKDRDPDSFCDLADKSCTSIDGTTMNM